ncbi:hypothetical protein HAX54_008693 [Datura stramonium]|uniref:Uncharacterized protein n=1 Tax=Datura stramonium TaxID=4076 RepID=A0ABS8TDN7_DATST|nr:hypothetical protein [Datura stramonium]
MCHFVYGLGTHLASDCTSSLLNKVMTISRLMDYSQEMEDLKKRIKADRDKNQHNRARSASYNDRNIEINFFNGKSSDREPSTTSAPPTNEVKMVKSRTLEHWALNHRVVLHIVIRSSFLVIDVLRGNQGNFA